MSAPTMPSTSLLTELLEFPPVSLVDDIINTVNDIMYKCTQAMETYLQQRRQIDGRDYSEEIQIGTAKLETLLENTVDKNLDRLELYVLRNILNIPSQLLEDGSFRLSHYEGLEFDEDGRSDEQLAEKIKAIDEAFRRHEILRARISDTRRAFERTRRFKQQLLQVLENGDVRSLAKSLSPVNETLCFLATQLRALYIENEECCSSKSISALLSRYAELHESGATRSGYIANRTRTVFQTIFGEDEEGQEHMSLDGDEDAGDAGSGVVVLRDGTTNTESVIENPDWSALEKHV